MNLFEMLEGHYKPQDGITREGLARFMKDSTAYTGAIIGSAGINSVHAAVLLAYAGNLDRVISDNEYNQFQAILGKAHAGFNSRLKPDDMTAKITQPIAKYGQML